MRIRPSIGIVGLILVVSGCTTSEHGLCPPDGGDQAVFDPALVGDWSFVTDDSARPKDGIKIDLAGKSIRFDRLKEGAKSYLITVPGEPGAAANDPPGVGHLVPIGGARFFDLLLRDPKSKDEPRHALFKVTNDKDVFTFHFMNPMYFSNHPTALSTTPWAVSGRIPLAKGQSPEFSIQMPGLTAQTPELRNFLEEHANDPELWPADCAIKCRRSKAQPGPDQRPR